jgi:hypothetical protein
MSSVIPLQNQFVFIVLKLLRQTSLYPFIRNILVLADAAVIKVPLVSDISTID